MGRSPADSSFYVHGTSTDEHRRLTDLNTLINEGCLRELALQGGERVLDVAGGLGQFTWEIARAVGPTGTVIGVGRDAAQLAEARKQAASQGEADPVEFREGDAFDLPLSKSEWGSFDLVHTRFLLEHVSDPLGVVKQMVAAAKPGGRITLADDDHDVMRLWPEPPGATDAWRAYLRAYDRAGNDTYVGRRLVQLLHEAGAEPRRNSSIFFAACAGNEKFAGLVGNLVGIMGGARGAVLKYGLYDPTYYDAALESIWEWGKRPDAAFWYGICWAEGVRCTGTD